MPTIQEEVDHNYEEFQKLLPAVIRDHVGKYALMKEGKIINYFSTAEDARNAGEAAIPDGIFSIQFVTDAPVNLGYFNYAVPVDPIQS
jgi:hypothetical protein